MINIRGLGKYYGDTRVLDDVSLDVEPGDVYGIVGHSGAGKSTLLRCMNGLEKYQEGSVRVMGREVSPAVGSGDQRPAPQHGDDLSELQSDGASQRV